ncbi:MAG: prephenate dehydrogenase [Acidobacteriota bacterium]|nr:prephenate dehydrogenase [Acidobacteriota bacterium]
MLQGHLINRVSILGSGLIGGSFALALRKYTEGLHITAWDKPDAAARAKERGAADEVFSGELKPAIQSADLIYVALPISTTLDVLPEIARHAAPHALVTDACSTKVRIVQAAEEFFPAGGTALFLGGHPMAGKELAGIANADANLFRETTYAFIGEPSRVADTEPAFEPDERGTPAMRAPTSRRTAADLSSEPRVAALLKIIGKIGARPLWLGAQQHDYAVGLSSHLPQLAAVALASFLYDHLDENGLPIALAGPGLRDSLRLAGSPYNTWRDIVLTNREVLSASLDLFARRLDELREKLASRELEADFDAANELYKLLRSF